MVEGGRTVNINKWRELYRQILRLIQERAYLGTGILVPLVTAYRREVQALALDLQVPDVRAAWLNR